MVPGSTFRYGSNFMRLTRRPRASSRQPMEAAASPLPSEDTTPPVTKMYFADISASDDSIVLWGQTEFVRYGGARLSISHGGGRYLLRPSYGFPTASLPTPYTLFMRDLVCLKYSRQISF